MTQRKHKLLSDEQAAYAAAQWVAGMTQREIGKSFGYSGGSAICGAIERFVRKYTPGVATNPDWDPRSRPFGFERDPYAPGRVAAQGRERFTLVPGAIAEFEARTQTKVPRMAVQTDGPTRPLSEEKLELHVEQRIQERANLGHLYKIEDGPEGPEASFTPSAATSLWRVVQDAVREAGWRIVKNGRG